ncbi:MAG TPA: hypothetical protein VGS97_26020 [Actinocrinis sp.]|uniref:hypothetical protein n=1 Tax=Actinocrinis sp. TaxID=1920516 RepID=UPI002DDCD424|nr:hypothetical protein [Actinocrinis sp.]HEV2347575.1 hypothetical protein [Actinocrinis sp.]
MRLAISIGEGNEHASMHVSMKKVVEISKVEIDLMDPEARSLRGRLAAHASWEKRDRKAHGEKLRAAKRAKHAREIDPNGVLPPDELEARIDSAIKKENAKAAYERWKKEAEKKAADPSGATDGPASETATTKSARTGQVSQ